MVRPKIAIIGGKGLLGKALSEKLPNSIPLGHEDIEITSFENVRAVLGKIMPDIIINCAAILNVDLCEKEPEKCFAVNRDGAANLLKAIKSLVNSNLVGNNPITNNLMTDDSITFIQISSSEVFGRSEGFKTEGYSEDEEPKPESAYQKSKFEAEQILQKFANDNPGLLKNWYIARAGWLYGESAGGRRKTFVENFVEALQKKDELTIIKDQWRSPTWTRDFADGLNNLMTNDYASGIYHIVSEVKKSEATTMDVIEEIKNFLGPKLHPPSAHSGGGGPPIKLVSQKDFFKVPRAPSNVLKNTKLPKLPYWRDSLQEYLKMFA